MPIESKENYAATPQESVSGRPRWSAGEGRGVDVGLGLGVGVRGGGGPGVDVEGDRLVGGVCAVAIEVAGWPRGFIFMVTPLVVARSGLWIFPIRDRPLFTLMRANLSDFPVITHMSNELSPENRFLLLGLSMCIRGARRTLLNS